LLRMVVFAFKKLKAIWPSPPDFRDGPSNLLSDASRRLAGIAPFVRAGGTAGLFSAILPGWSPGGANSQVVTPASRDWAAGADPL